MLKPSNDRLDYSHLLTPPVGYETAFAIGTTYSLDLDALIGISISLGLSESIDSELKDNPIYLLEALQKTADKIIIFCEGGQIKVPAKANSLHILLEKMVSEIVLKNKKSFHPKFWLIKYQNKEGHSLYRIIVLSRNLTFDRSWDVAISLDGEIKEDGRIKYGHEKSRPIAAFLQSLLDLNKRNKIDPSKRSLIKKMIKEILNVKFELDEKEYTDFQFCPVGIEGYDIEHTGLFETYHQLFVISPFFSDSTISRFNQLALKNPLPNILVTRKAELAKLKPTSATNFDVYVLKDLIVDGEEALSEGDEEDEKENNQQQDIHAKVYLRTKYANSELFLGSLNASNNACYGNVEFLFKLSGKRRYLNIENLKKDLFGDNEKDNPFERIKITAQEKHEESKTNQLEKMIKQICRLKSTARVVESSKNYRLEVRFDKVDDIDHLDHVFISPLLSTKEKNLSKLVEFDDLTLLHLSEFYIIKAVDEDEVVQRVIKIKTENMPDMRESAVVNSIIKDKNGFIQYLSFLLGDDYLLTLLENQRNEMNGFLFGDGEQIPALYEKMLKAAAHSPRKFDEIKRLLELISDDTIIPEGFKELYEVFEKVVSKNWR